MKTVVRGKKNDGNLFHHTLMYHTRWKLLYHFSRQPKKKNFNPFSLLLAVFYALNYQNKNITSIPWDQFSNARALSVSIQKTCEQTLKEILQKWVQILKFSGYYINSFWSTSAVNTALVTAHAQQKLLFDVSNNGQKMCDCVCCQSHVMNFYDNRRLE